MSIILRADSALTSPITGTPKLVSALDGLRTRYDAKTLTGLAGADITTWGTTDTLFQKTAAQAWPTVDTTDGRTAKFTRASFSAIQSTTLSPSISAPCTIVALVKTTNGGIVAAGTSSAFRLKASGGFWRITRWGSTETNEIQHTAAPSGGWQVVTAVLNGSSSSLTVDGVRVTGSVSGVSQASRLCVGSHTFGTTGYETDYFDGNIAEIGVYSKALAPDAVAFIASDMRNRHNK